MTTISGQYNVLLGYKTVAPNPLGSHQIVLGTANDTAYLGGGAITVSSGLNLNTALALNSSNGTKGQTIISRGNGFSPYWGTIPPQQLFITSYTALVAYESTMYTISNRNTSIITVALPIPSSANGLALWVKVIGYGPYIYGIIVLGNGNIFTKNSTTAITQVQMDIGSSALFESDGVNWYILSSTF